MGSTDRPREIIVRPKDGGATRPEDRTAGLYVRDAQTGANMWLPVYGIKRDGEILEGRDRAAHVAGLLLAAQGADGRVSWDRDTVGSTVFVVFQGGE